MLSRLENALPEKLSIETGIIPLNRWEELMTRVILSISFSLKCIKSSSKQRYILYDLCPNHLFSNIRIPCNDYIYLFQKWAYRISIPVNRINVHFQKNSKNNPLNPCIFQKLWPEYLLYFFNWPQKNEKYTTKKQQLKRLADRKKK